MKHALVLGAVALLALPLAFSVVSGQAQTPNELVAASPKQDWTGIAPADLLVMDLPPLARFAGGKPAERRVVIQLMPAPFSQGWVGNIRKLAKAHWWDGLTIYRVQDNYVTQWGDGEGDDKAKAKPLPPGLSTVTEAEYLAPVPRVMLAAPGGGRTDAPAALPLLPQSRDAYAAQVGFTPGGWAFASDGNAWWPLHCYGMVGVARDLSPDTGSGAELYAVIGHAPRQLDRNIALVGRVIEGMEHLSSLPRGAAPMGVYAQPRERTPILSVRLGDEVPGLPRFEQMLTGSASFARYGELRANRRDAFFLKPAGGVDVCNVPVPVRRAKAG